MTKDQDLEKGAEQDRFRFGRRVLAEERCKQVIDQLSAPIVRELSALNDSLQALAYAALGQRGPEVRRRAG